MNNKVLKFVSYSNTSMKRIRSTSPKSAVASQNILTHGSDSSNASANVDYDAPSLANAVGGVKSGSFAQKIKAKKAGAGFFGRGAQAAAQSNPNED